MTDLFHLETPSVDALKFMMDAAIELEMEREPSDFLDKVLHYSRDIVGARAGSLYLVDGDELSFLACQNDDLDISQFITVNTEQPHKIARTEKSIAGYASLHGEPLMIQDAHHIDNSAPYSFDPAIDKKSGFHTQTILAMPLRHPKEGVIGVMELINLQIKDTHHWSIGLVRHFAMLSASSIVNLQMEKSLEAAYLETIFRLGVASEYKDDDTYAHVQRIRYTSRIIANEMGCSLHEQQAIFHASAMHDLGKIGIPDNILNKPAHLEADEWEIMKNHATMGAEILKDSDAELLQLCATIAVGHHEHWDGNGYPNGLAGAEIPLEARIVAVADVFDALVNQRAYKKAWPIEDALALIEGESGSHFDPAVVEAFLNRIKEVKQVQQRFLVTT
ncbi:MAG: HD domain-containing phosphohydrolase [Mariprofundales bacterium]|nr:HD domain-containing phosphohydrolase [Mariprofundales bacterium]